MAEEKPKATTLRRGDILEFVSPKDHFDRRELEILKGQRMVVKVPHDDENAVAVAPFFEDQFNSWNINPKECKVVGHTTRVPRNLWQFRMMMEAMANTKPGKKKTFGWKKDMEVP